MSERFRCADDVAWVDASEVGGDSLPVAWVARVPDGSPMTLEGPAWLVWVSLVEAPEGDTMEGIIRRVERLRAPALGPVSVVDAGELQAFIEQLHDAGLVERV